MVPYESDLYRQPHDYYQYLNSDGESHGGKSKKISPWSIKLPQEMDLGHTRK